MVKDCLIKFLRPTRISILFSLVVFCYSSIQVSYAQSEPQGITGCEFGYTHAGGCIPAAWATEAHKNWSIVPVYLTYMGEPHLCLCPVSAREAQKLNLQIQLQQNAYDIDFSGNENKRKELHEQKKTLEEQLKALIEGTDPSDATNNNPSDDPQENSGTCITCESNCVEKYTKDHNENSLCTCIRNCNL